MATIFENLRYQPGFGNQHSTEALAGALPEGQNSPQLCPYGLYAEQVNGSAFTAPRAKNLRSWLYRIRPSVLHEPFKPSEQQPIEKELRNLQIEPNQLRWNPLDLPSDHEKITFVDGLHLFASSPSGSAGLGIFLYACNASMYREAFYDADGDLLLVPQMGRLAIQTELGNLVVEPKEIVVIPRGIKFRVELLDGTARGYAAEVGKGHFELPGLGPIGANGLANPRDFLAPVAAFEHDEGGYQLVAKFQQRLFRTSQTHSPFDVVAWHGNYTPFKYDLRKFNTMNTVSYDHADPSIFTVLTVSSEEVGTALLDFVLFPPRWMVATESFRPPYFHRNIMTEFMGMIHGHYDGKVAAGGFQPGGASLHSCMTGHGPDALAFVRATIAELTPQYYDGGLAFMFETCLGLQIGATALASATRQRDYTKCWAPLPVLFTGEAKPVIDWKKVTEEIESKDAALKEK
eukprot:gene11121-12389_t